MNVITITQDDHAWFFQVHLDTDSLRFVINDLATFRVVRNDSRVFPETWIQDTFDDSSLLKITKFATRKKKRLPCEYAAEPGSVISMVGNG